MALVIVGHRAGAPFLQGKTRLRPVERLDLALFIDGQDDGMGRRRDVETDDVMELLGKGLVIRQFEAADSLKLRQRCGASPCSCQIFTTEEAAMPTALAIARTVQCVASCRGVSSVRATTSSTSLPSSGAMPGGLLLSCKRPSTPSVMKRSCQRQTHVFDLPVASMIATVPKPLLLIKMILARHTCF
jgi:hypothetical protein